MTAEHPLDGVGHRNIMEIFHAQKSDGPGNGINLPGQAEIGTVDQGQQSGNKGRIQPDHRFKILQGRFLIVHQLDQLA